MLRIEAKTILIYAGDNDLAAGRQPKQIVDDFSRIMSKMRSELPDAAHRLDRDQAEPVALAAHAEDDRGEHGDPRILERTDPQHMAYVDIVTPMLGADGKPRPELFLNDMLHMKPEGYAPWTDAVKPVLDRLEK